MQSFYKSFGPSLVALASSILFTAACLGCGDSATRGDGPHTTNNDDPHGKDNNSELNTNNNEGAVLAEMDPTDRNDLCESTSQWSYEQVSREDRCVLWALSAPPAPRLDSDDDTRQYCATRKASCLDSDRYTFSAQCSEDKGEECSLTVEDVVTCAAARAAAYNDLIDAWPDCTTVTANFFDAHDWPHLDLPGECNNLLEQCMSFYYAAVHLSVLE